MLTVGVDLATQPNKTAVATIEWADDAATVTDVVTRGTDALILQACLSADAVGFDAPFGWPDEFSNFIVQHREGRQPLVKGSEDAWRRQMAYRLTDRVVASEFRQRPLSVSTDRIGLTAMRMSSLLGQLREAGQLVDRAGGTRVVEVYPAAALKVWGLRSASYKGPNMAHLTHLVDELQSSAGWFDLGEFDAVCRSSDDAFDAVVAALIARAHACGQWRRPEPHELGLAASEGWIIVPTCTVGALASL